MIARRSLLLACGWAAGLLGSACGDGLRLVVVDDELGGGGVMTPSAGNGGNAGTLSVIPIAGTLAEGGKLEPAGGSVGSGGGGGSDEPMAGGAGSPPDVPPWEAEPVYTASFHPFTAPEQYVRHQTGKGVISPIDLGSTLERADATFDLIPGLAEPECLSFRSVNINGSFFRHSGSRIYLNAADDTPLYFSDATFCPEPGLADAKGISFRSYNYDWRVIHLRNENELWIDDVPDPAAPEYALFAKESTFFRADPLSALGN